MKLAALDLGSNSFHLLVADAAASGDIAKIHSQKEVLGLGAVVQQLGQLSEPAFQAAFASVRRLNAVAQELGAETLLTVATSALRDARNGESFCQLCENQLGVRIELLSGEAEARLAYLGARSAGGSTGQRALVVDVGGGSVELAAGEDSSCDVVQSLPLGFLRLAHAFRLTEVGGPSRLTSYVQLECERVRWQVGRFDTLLLSGGTARALGKLLDGGAASATPSQLLQLCCRIRACSPAYLCALGVDAARSASLAAGAAVMAGVLAGFAPHAVRISPRGLREGVLLRELSRRAKTRAA